MTAATPAPISLKLAEPKHFTGKQADAKSWISTLKRYFLAVGVPYTGDGTERAARYAIALMAGNASKWVDRLEARE